ncbi:MAG: MmcQ/YjbR family DNA-binding protein [Fusobacterium sp.]|nr:MmcQ/YjbR family DNA-binding protein [Fusobacterium sp.]
MSIEEKIFKKYSVDFDKLEKYGFTKEDSDFKIEKLFKDDLFKAVIVVDSAGKVSGTVYDLENDDEFLPLRVENNQGAFVAEVRTAYEELLEDIRNNCFSENFYIYPQSNRITKLLIEKYGDKPEFLWEKFQGSGVFRNPETRKWYLAILDVDRSKLQPDKKGLIEVADIKLAPEKIEKLLKQKHFYPAYHMNKKSWITIILDDSVPDEKIMELIEESHGFTVKKSKV